MKVFEFSIIASGLNPQADDFESRFYDRGCDDATVSFQKGHIILDFAREAASFSEAIGSAMEAVQDAGALINRVEPDPLVSLSEIAARAHCSRAAVSNYWKGNRGNKDFPAPVARVTSESPLWDWSDVARWLYRKGSIEKEAAIDAAVVRSANEAITEKVPATKFVIDSRVREYERSLEPA